MIFENSPELQHNFSSEKRMLNFSNYSPKNRVSCFVPLFTFLNSRFVRAHPQKAMQRNFYNASFFFFNDTNNNFKNNNSLARFILSFLFQHYQHNVTFSIHDQDNYYQGGWTSSRLISNKWRRL